MRVRTNKTTKMKNSILAIPAALAAMPVNPNRAAISAMTKKIIDQRSIGLFCLVMPTHLK